MQIFNQLIGQIRELMQSMTPASRILGAMLLICIVVSSAFLVRGSTSRSNEYLFGGRDLTESELDSMESAFGVAGLYEYERVGRRIKIPSADRSNYLKALVESHALPRQLGSSIEEALSSASFLEPIEMGQRRLRHAANKTLPMRS